MKALRIAHLAALVLTAACSSGAPMLTDAERAAVAAAVDSATRAFEGAQRARDAERTLAHLAPDFYMYTDGVRSSYDSVVASIRRTMPAFQHLEPGFSDVTVRVLGPRAAFVSLSFRDSIVTTSGDTLQFRGPTTLIWERRDNTWLIVYADADHYPVPRN